VPPELPSPPTRLMFTDEQKQKLRADLNTVSQNCKVMGEMLSELTPGQESDDDWQLLEVYNNISLYFT